MVIQPIIKIGNPFLRQRSVVVVTFGASLQQLQKDLQDTLLDFRARLGYGRGISAVQIGVLSRVIYIKTEEFEEMLVNSVIVKKSKKMFWTWDSCFSADIAFFVKVQRHYAITVEYYDVTGTKKSLETKRDLSELLQHEIDHLDGKLFVDYITDPAQLAMREIIEKEKESFL